ncbi:MAG: Hsp20/alpha crystallin family protein [Archaeoglobaceae archaeon]|nr:Hsp20/alpha crystallin family protein [Archaeoglobaceae archaeon]MCX8152281.1 Hsp20/alpha crystallin family protein [Archaeoglobaceae archaeon]MDW8013959.1 Hsp20/alpha crystallin family protein [Archaeoglobaceae archaeon]
MIFDPFEELRKFQDRISRVFEEFERRFPEIRVTYRGFPVDVIEEEDKITVIADLPGFSKEDIEVYFEDGDLVIKAERKLEEEKKEISYIRKERSYGSFIRRLTLPFEVDTANVKAKFNNGILEVTIPKAVKAKKTVKIE